MAELKKNEAKSHYEIWENGKVAGFAEYRPIGNAILFSHTEVDTAYEGQGLGSQLAHFALEDVRAMGKTTIPMCPFIAAYIRRHPEYIDLVNPSQRGVFKL